MLSLCDTAEPVSAACVDDATDLYKREVRVDQPPPMRRTMPGDADSQMVTVEAPAASATVRP